MRGDVRASEAGSVREERDSEEGAESEEAGVGAESRGPDRRVEGGPRLFQVGTRREAAWRHWKQSSSTVSTSFCMSGPKFCVWGRTDDSVSWRERRRETRTFRQLGSWQCLLWR